MSMLRVSSVWVLVIARTGSVATNQTHSPPPAHQAPLSSSVPASHFTLSWLSDSVTCTRSFESFCELSNIIFSTTDTCNCRCSGIQQFVIHIITCCFSYFRILKQLYVIAKWKKCNVWLVTINSDSDINNPGLMLYTLLQISCRPTLLLSPAAWLRTCQPTQILKLLPENQPMTHPWLVTPQTLGIHIRRHGDNSWGCW